MTQRRLRRLGMLALPIAAAFPIMAQSNADTVDPNDPHWAHPPYVLLAGPFDRPATTSGYSPGQIKGAYGLAGLNPIDAGTGQTIALIDAYNNPDAASDLNTFDTAYGLPACTTTNGCLQVIYASGSEPGNDAAWSGESSLDIEYAHAIAPQANIMLVEAESGSIQALLAAVKVAVQNGATVVSMSWSGPEFEKETTEDSEFNVTGVIFCASSGDNGHGAAYPAASPYVVAVGGTTLEISGRAWSSETAWSGSGGGESKYETEPSYQSSVQTSGKRGIPDVAWDANPATGVAVYSEYGFGGWVELGGTSVGAPSWAGLFAIVESIRAAHDFSPLTLPRTYLYPNAEGDYHDITSGTNGGCGAQCTAGPGYDFVTGLGSPKANLLIPALVY